MLAKDYTSDEKRIVKNVIDRYENSGVFLIEPGDPVLTEFYDIQLKLAGVTAAAAPQFTQLWQQTKRVKRVAGRMSEANTSGAQPVYSIVRLDSTDGKRYQTDAIGSLPVQATNVTQTLGLFDGGADNVGKVEYKSDYVYTADCTIGASGDYPQSQTGGSFPVTVIYTFAQTVGQQTVYGAEIVTTQSYPKEMINDSPRNLYNQRMIKICLTRDDGDCDYRTGYDQDGTVKVPIKGNITYFGNIDLSNGKPVNASNTIYLIRTRAGGDPITPYGGYNIFNSTATRISGSNITWDLDWLKFNRVDFESGEMVYYVFKITLDVEGRSIAAFITNAPKESDPDRRLLNTVQIKPMQIIYGCLAEDTLILMQDGTEKPINALTADEFVICGNNHPRRIENITTGREQHYIDITARDQAAREYRIKASLGHPFVTANGICLARELTSGMRLKTRHGECEITALSLQPGELTVYNLQLSADSPLQKTQCALSTFYANGVLVGDALVQHLYEDEYHQRPKNVLKTLPAEWHQDYHNMINAAEE